MGTVDSRPPRAGFFSAHSVLVKQGPAEGLVLRWRGPAFFLCLLKQPFQENLTTFTKDSLKLSTDASALGFCFCRFLVILMIETAATEYLHAVPGNRSPRPLKRLWKGHLSFQQTDKITGYLDKGRFLQNPMVSTYLRQRVSLTVAPSDFQALILP